MLRTGGKITHIAELMKNEGKVIGWDIHPHKIKLVNLAAQRLGIKNIELEVQDAEKKVEKYNNKADRVLVDAPCTGFGILRRKPDIKWNRKFEDIVEMARIQINILNTVSNYIKPGGKLVYSTCTFGDEENINTINNFLKHNQDFELINIEDYIPKDLDIPTAKKGYIQLFPNVNNTDGFFICKMKRVK